MAAVGAASFFTDALTHVFTGVFTDVFIDVFPDVVTRSLVHSLMYSLVYSLTYLLVYALTYSLMYSLTFFQKNRKMRIQEGHFLKIALNLDLTLPNDGKCPALLISCGIIDLGVFCVELWSFYVSKRISVPMSYISFWEHCLLLRD